MVNVIIFLLILFFAVDVNAQTPPYGQTIGSLSVATTLNGADIAPIVQLGVSKRAPVSLLASFLGSPQGSNKDIQYNNNGVFGGSDQFAFDGYAVGIGTPTPRPQTSLDIGFRTDSIILPSGTTAQEPVNPINGMMRFNNTTGFVEAWFNGKWNQYGSGSTPPVGSFITTESNDVITTESGDGLVTE